MNNCTWPNVKRIDQPEALGVKTCFNGVQYGEAIAVKASLKPEIRERRLNQMETELRDSIAKHYG